MIRNARPSDWDDIMEIYAIARGFMKTAGNPTQWGDIFPPEDMVRNDIEVQQNYVVEIDGRVQAVFAMIPGVDPTYLVIEGAWLNDEPYAAVHRVASRGEVKGLTGMILDWAMEQYDSIRIDTHKDNVIMHHILSKHGFTRCGVIHLLNGDPREAFQKNLRNAPDHIKH